MMGFKLAASLLVLLPIALASPVAEAEAAPVAEAEADAEADAGYGHDITWGAFLITGPASAAT